MDKYPNFSPVVTRSQFQKKTCDTAKLENINKSTTNFSLISSNDEVDTSMEQLSHINKYIVNLKHELGKAEERNFDYENAIIQLNNIIIEKDKTIDDLENELKALKNPNGTNSVTVSTQTVHELAVADNDDEQDTIVSINCNKLINECKKKEVINHEKEDG